MSGLVEGARALGLELSEAQLRAFDTYRHELLDWNSRVNLTAITDPAEIASKHFLDSLSVFAAPNSPPGTQPALSLPKGHSTLALIDVGAGAGFPGVPLKIIRPAWRVTLLEATRKKCDFLQHLIDVLRLDGARVVWGRAEAVGHADAERERYDWAVARAVADLGVLAEYLLPFARVGGTCIAWKGDGIEAEVSAAKGAIGKLGGRLEAVIPVNVPGVEQPRHLVVIGKTAQTPGIYPRREGLPAKRPLK